MKKILLLVAYCGLYFSGIAQTLTATPSTLSFPATPVAIPSTGVNSIINGSSLSPATGTVMVIAPSDFQVYNGSAWASSATISYSGGTISSSSIQVRFNPSAVGSYSDSVMLTGGGASIPVYVTGTGTPSCTGTPSAGTASASAYSFCSAGTVTLTDAGATTGVGISMQWQSSPDSSTWSNIYGATAATYTFTIGGSAYYRCSVYCSISGGGASTGAVYVSYYGSTCPHLTAAPASLTFPTTVPSTSSSPLTTVVNGTLLTPSAGSLTVVSSNTVFEIYNGSAWVTSYTIAYTSGTISTYSQQVRFSPAATGSFSGFIYVLGGGAVSLAIPVNGVGGTSCSGTPTAGTTTTSLAIASTTTPFNLTATGSTTGGIITLQWESSPTGSGSWSAVSGATLATSTVSGISANTYYRLAITCGTSGITAYSATNYVAYAASCSGTPAAGTATATSYALCSSASDTVTNTGYSFAAGITLQWQSSATSGGSYSNIYGATNATFIFSGGSTFYLRCVVSCSTGPSAATTPIYITYYGSGCPVLSASPASLTFPATTSGTTSSPMSSVLTGTLLSPAVGSLTVTAPSNFAVSSTAGGTYTGSYTIAYSGGTITANSIYVVFVSPSTPGTYSGNVSVTGGGALTLNIPINGTSATTCSGTPSAGTVSTSVTTAGTTTPITIMASGYTAIGGITLQWQSSPDSATWASITGATLGTYSFTGISANTYYRLVVTCSASGSTSYSAGALITMVAACSGTPAAGSIWATATTVCAATPVTFTDTGYSVASGLAFQWQASTTSGGTYTNISGATNNTFTATIIASMYYKCVVTCVSSSLSATTAPVGITYGICATLVAAPSSLSFPATAASATSAPLATVLTGTYLSPAVGNLTVTAPANFEVSSSSGGTFAYSYTIAYTGGTITATSIYAHFVAPSSAGTYSGNITVTGGGSATLNIPVNGTSGCSGSPVGGTSSFTTATTSCTVTTVTLTNTGHTATAGISLLWESSPTGSGSWTPIAGATNATYTVSGLTATTYYHCLVTCSISGLSTPSAAATVTVDRIIGHIAYSSTAPDTLDMKVWLIYHNTSAGTLTAIDSTITCLDGGTPYYEFNGMGAGSYLVKAKSLDYTSTIVGGSGIIPTYGLSNPHWDTAVTITHTSSIDSMHINMVYGTVPTGPGFIGGFISSGAGKNTAGDVPAVNMIVYLMDATRHVLTYSYTDASGNYGFSNLGYGSYIIYPEDLNYATTPSSVITLTASATSVTATNFKQHTTSKTITPNLPSVIATVNLLGSDCVLYPNPVADELSVKVDEGAFSAVSVINSLGIVVMQQPIVGAATILNVKRLSAGIYTVKLNGEKGSVVKRFVKQ